MPTTIADNAIPARMAAPTSPTSSALAPLAASTEPKITAPNPYRNARIAWIHRMIRRSLSTFTVATRSASSQRDSDHRPEPQHRRRDPEPEPEDGARDRSRPERRAGAQGAPSPDASDEGDQSHGPEPDQVENRSEPARRQADDEDRERDPDETDEGQAETEASVVIGVGGGDRHGHGPHHRRTLRPSRCGGEGPAPAQADLRPRIAIRLLIFDRAWPYVRPVCASMPTTWLRKNSVRACASVIGSPRKRATTIADWPSVSEASNVSPNSSHKNRR